MSTAASASSTRPITISLARLREILASIDRPQPIGMTCLTEPEQRKCPLGKVSKLARLNAFIGATYVNSVNRQREKAGIDVALEERDHDWATRVTPCLLAKPDAKSGGERYYLAAQIQRADRVRAHYLLPRQRGGRTILAVVPKEQVADYLRPERLASAAEGLESPVVFKSYALESIMELRMGGRRYRVRNTSAANA